MSFLIRRFTEEDAEAVIKLWEETELLRPWNDPYKDIRRKMDDDPSLFFVGEVKSRLVASCMAGYDGHRGWIYYLAVEKGSQGQGYGRELIEHCESELRRRGCPKVELMVRDSNTGIIDFYKKLDYRMEPVKILGKRLITD